MGVRKFGAVRNYVKVISGRARRGLSAIARFRTHRRLLNTDRGFGAKHEGGKRAVVTGETQRGVIAEPEAKYPDAIARVARVRENGPGPDKFRKV